MEYLDSMIQAKNNKLHMVTMQMQKVKNDCNTKLREKDYEIERLKAKLHQYDLNNGCDHHKLYATIEKLKCKIKEVRFGGARTSVAVLTVSCFHFRLGGTIAHIQSE